MLTSKMGMCAVLTSVILAAAACSHDNDQASSPQTASNPPAATAPAPAAPPIDTAAPNEPGMTNQQQAGATTGLDNTTGSAMNGDPSASATASAQTGAVGHESSTQLSDDDIVAIIEAINKGEIDEAKLAKTKAQSSDVKAFANMMLAEHTAALQQEQTMATQSQLVANTSNDTCQTLTTDGRQEMDTLRNKSGSDFDTAYIDAMVQGHQKALGLISDTLIPNAKNAQLAAQLQSLKTHVEMHLRKAQDAQQKLSGQTFQPQSGQNQPGTSGSNPSGQNNPSQPTNTGMGKP